MKAIIFDLDGTLIDSMWLWDNLASNYLLSLGIIPPKDLSDSLRTLTLEQAVPYLQDRFKLNNGVEEIYQGMENLLADYYCNKLELKPYVLETLEELNRRRFPMAIATATDEHLAAMVLARHKIDKYFDFIQTSRNVGFSKAKPEFFEVAIRRLNLEAKNIWVFEDALHCIISAKECGLNVVAVKDKSAMADIDKIKQIADVYIDDFSQLEVNIL